MRGGISNMDKMNLVEIKKGKTGYGLLIENDGYISPEDNRNKALFESILKEDKEDKEFFCPNPFRVYAVFQKYGIKNANGRIYPEGVLRREVEKFQDKIREKRALMECNHPESLIIDLDRVCGNIVELHWEKSTLVGQMDILVSEGFRRTGIISCKGDQIANLLLSGIKIGVSSRGAGSVTQKFGVTMVGEDYDLVCWDVVSDPSTPNSWITPGEKIPETYIENRQTSGPILTENDKFAKFDNWLKL